MYRTTVGQGIECIEQQVQHYLLDLIGVDA